MDVNLTFDSSNESVELIKLSALYYDKVNILCPLPAWDGEGHEILFHSKKILDSASVLVENGIACIEHPHDNFLLPINFLSNELPGLIQEYISRALRQDKDGLDNFLQLIGAYTNLEHEGYSLRFNAFDEPGEKTMVCIYMILHGQLTLVYNSICKRRNVITSSEITNDILKKFLERKKEKVSRMRKTPEQLISTHAIPIFLPSFHEMSFENILELRHIANDELQEMRYYVGNLSEQYSPDDINLENPKRFLERKINPAIKQLESKIYGLRAGTIQRALKSLQNPSTYTPMLTTFVTDIPAHIALAGSIGLITVNAGLEYSKQIKEIKNDPLFFVPQLRKKVKNPKDYDSLTIGS